MDHTHKQSTQTPLYCVILKYRMNELESILNQINNRLVRIERRLATKASPWVGRSQEENDTLSQFLFDTTDQAGAAHEHKHEQRAAGHA